MHLFIHLIYFSSRPSILTVFSVFQIFFLFKHLYRFRDNLIWPRRPSPEQRPPHRDVDASFSHSLSLFLFSLPSLSETFIFPPHFHPWHTFPVPIKCQLNSTEPICLPLRPSDGGAGLHGDASGPGEACGDDLQGAASPPFPRAAIRVASIKPATPRRSLWCPERWDGVHHTQPEPRRLGGVHLQCH